MLFRSPKLLEGDADPLFAKLRFLARYGLRSTDVSLSECEALQGERRDRVIAFCREHQITLTVRPPLRFFLEERRELLAQVDRWLIFLDKQGRDLPIGLVTVGGSPQHRFAQDVSLAQQLEELRVVLTPLARGCCDHGLRLGIENHGDYYVSDLVELCAQTPHLGIFLDTGNCFLVGEKPLPAASDAAPLLVGGHCKDQKVRPLPRNTPLCFEVGNAMPGEGDVPLKEIFRVLCAHAPVGAPLVMEIECFPANWSDPVPEIERAISFVRSLTH